MAYLSDRSCVRIEVELSFQLACCIDLVLFTLRNTLQVMIAAYSPIIRLILRRDRDQVILEDQPHCYSSSTPSTPSPLSRRFPNYITPSCSPGSLLTRFCSQSSKSFAASLCVPIHQHMNISLTSLEHSHNTLLSCRLFVPPFQCPTLLL
jgi:hypothetical protein